MAELILQGEKEREQGIYYTVDSPATPIGIGGTGKVYKGQCVNELTGEVIRPVAIKFIYDDILPENSKIIERAMREASLQLRSENLVEMLGFIETVDTDTLGNQHHHYHVVSELLQGITLQEVIEGNVPDPSEDGGFAMGVYNEYRQHPEEFAKKVVRSVLSGIMAMHDHGYIHRDIDPSNIMLTTDGRIKLIDFGIAKKIEALTNNDRSYTVAGKFIGKAKYAAPEQVMGDVSHQNQTTDVYAIGILLYQLVTGQLPFNGPSHEVLQMQLNRKMPLEHVKNSKLRSIIKKATEKKQTKRYQSSSEFRAALDGIKSPEAGRSINWTPLLIVILGLVGLGLGVVVRLLL